MNQFELEERLRKMQPNERDVIINAFKAQHQNRDKAEATKEQVMADNVHLKWEKKVLLSRIEYLEGQLKYERGK